MRPLKKKKLEKLKKYLASFGSVLSLIFYEHASQINFVNNLLSLFTFKM